MYEGTWESVGTHRVPAWYDDAKLGIFIHWGLDRCRGGRRACPTFSNC